MSIAKKDFPALKIRCAARVYSPFALYMCKGGKMLAGDLESFWAIIITRLALCSGFEYTGIIFAPPALPFNEVKICGNASAR